MASTLKTQFLQLWHYLQDPHHVALFQQMCGVRGTFSRNPADCTEARQTSLLSNGAYGNGVRLNGGGEGEAADHLRQRKSISIDNCCRAAASGSDDRLLETAVSKTTGEKPGCHNRYNNPYSADTSDGEHPQETGEVSESNGAGLDNMSEVTDDSSCPTSTVKPLRKNSLTGDAGQEFLIENKFLFYLFTFGSELGNELFYITFFPFVIWNVDAYVGRRLIVVWVWVMYVGQCTKDLIRWPRPASPPVVKVEMFYNSEYSMPSTHAMSGTAIPLSLFLLTYGRWEYPFLVGFTLALSWCVLVCLSRIYMGMHSILDIIMGILYSLLILLVFSPALEPIDRFNLSHRWAPVLIVSLHAGLGLFSFTLDTWSTSRGDTAQILGSGAGVALASHLNTRLGLLPDAPLSSLPLRSPPLTAALAGVCALRFLLGVLLLLATRVVMKAVTIPLVCRLTGVSGADVREARQHMQVELPYRYIVYGTVGFNVLFLVPLVFGYLGLS
ncbi:sphingosine-1-phosphate phosphatase 1 [Alosa pseudoharengus]|uniref:sphingosine-1-phosphate phosphatase 1 n=1 Tax=Alosa pseudoharengus TaxID=34774 RepID=UPI003F89CBCE